MIMNDDKLKLLIDVNVNYAINLLSEEEQLQELHGYPSKIKFIIQPSFNVQLAVVSRAGNCIQYIKDSHVQVQLAAIEEDSDAIAYIKDPCLEVQLAAIRRGGYLIKYIKEPALDVLLEAIKYIDTPELSDMVLDHLTIEELKQLKLLQS
jgi:hypothetical protein